MKFYIAKLNDQGCWTLLKRFSTYDDADSSFDRYCDKYPNAYLDIISEDEI